LAIDGFKISADGLDSRLQEYGFGREIQLTIFQGDRLMTVAVALAKPEPQQYQLQPIEQPNELQSQLLAAWSGSTIVSAQI
jgi:predicted metalloprotease with PDZ domain